MGSANSEEVSPLTLGKPYAGECHEAEGDIVVPLALLGPQEYWQRVLLLYRSSGAVMLGNVAGWSSTPSLQ